MIPVKIQCPCGQRYAFDVEPVQSKMPTSVFCPSCGVDGTVSANQFIAQTLAITPPAPASGSASAPAAPVSRLRPVEAPSPAASSLAVASAPSQFQTQAAARQGPKFETAPSEEFHFGRGILGAFLGAGLGVAIVYAFYEWAGFRFPLLGVVIGVLTGWGAKLLYKGADHQMGMISGLIALIAVVGVLYLMYGTFPIISIISVCISVSMAYKAAS